MDPTVGRIVIYKFNAQDAEYGIGREGETCPAIVCKVWAPQCVNLRLLPDNDKIPHRRSVSFGDFPGGWTWPERAPEVKPVPEVSNPRAAAAPDPTADPSPSK